MQQAAKLQFERAVHEYAQWRAISDDERSPAPAWWWGPAFEVLGEQQAMPKEWCSILVLPSGTSYAIGAQTLLKSLADQALLPWPDDFPRKKNYSGAA